MKKLVGLVCAALFLPLPAISDPLVISASGRGTTEVAAIASAKKQVAVDAQTAGFLPSDGYRIGSIRVVGISPSGSGYVARVDADLVKDLESKRVVFVISGEYEHSPRLQALVQRVRTALAEQRLGRQPHLEVIDMLATGSLRISSLADLQRPGVDADLDQITRNHQADALYLLSANGENSPVFLVSARNDGSGGKTIRTLRDGANGGSQPLTAQLVAAVRQDIGRPPEFSAAPSILTLPSAGVSVRKGQSVIVYASKNDAGGFQESSIVTHGIVTEVAGAKVRVLTEQAVSAAESGKLRLRPLPKRGVIITESDW